jgi:DNA-binding response OmpR family regulator
MTARALQIEQESALAAGCDGVIVKPFDLMILANALPHVLDDCQKTLNVPGLALPWTHNRRTRAERREDEHAGSVTSTS